MSDCERLMVSVHQASLWVAGQAAIARAAGQLLRHRELLDASLGLYHSAVDLRTAAEAGIQRCGRPN